MPDQRRINAALSQQPGELGCVMADMSGEKIGDWFEIQGSLAAAWRRVAERPLQIYKQLARIVNSSRLPHVVPYEAAISIIFREEIALALAQTSITRDPTESAMIMARRRVGAPFPRGDARFKIEALLETIKLRLHLVQLVKPSQMCCRPCRVLPVLAFGM